EAEAARAAPSVEEAPDAAPAASARLPDPPPRGRRLEPPGELHPAGRPADAHDDDDDDRDHHGVERPGRPDAARTLPGELHDGARRRLPARDGGRRARAADVPVAPAG